MTNFCPVRHVETRVFIVKTKAQREREQKAELCKLLDESVIVPPTEKAQSLEMEVDNDSKF